MKLTKAHEAVLIALSCAYDDYYLTFHAISQEGGGGDLRAIRRTVRHLARNGLAEYGRGLWTEDGEPAGSGYRITEAGRKALSESQATGE